jgi:small subunit ribosomal protein S1
MSWTRNVRHPSKIVSIGDEIEAVVLKVDPKDEKISLGMKQIEEDPWLALPVKYPTGTKLSGTVRNLTSFGAFVEIEPGIDGLVHVSDMSWTRRVEHPSEIVQKGQELEVMVLDVDAENKRISLGVKQLQDDPWPSISERFAPGVEPDGKVARLQDKGVVVDLGDDIEGFVPVSHSGIEDAHKLEEYYAAGDDVSLRVIESDAGNRRIVLEVTETPPRKSQAEIEAARAAAAAAAAAAAEADGEDDEEAAKRARSARSSSSGRGAATVVATETGGGAAAVPTPAADAEAAVAEADAEAAVAEVDGVADVVEAPAEDEKER